jgi:hypothetical protein
MSTTSRQDELSTYLQSKINTHIETHGPIQLYILTPCYGGICYVNYTTCLINSMKILASFGITVKVEFCRNDSLVTRARNNLVAKAMVDEKTTHIIFIDNDITWNPYDIVKLILAKKSVIGGAYPIKNYNWGRLIDPIDPSRNIIKEWIDRRNNTGINLPLDNASYIQSKLLRYNINYKSNTMEIKENVAEVRHLATGFMLIERETIEKMMEAFPDTKYVDDVSYLEGDENKYAYALFDCGVYDGHYFSEDWLFCHRWAQIGGSIFLDISIQLNHCGTEDFHGSYLASLM